MLGEALDTTVIHHLCMLNIRRDMMTTHEEKIKSFYHYVLRNQIH